MLDFPLRSTYSTHSALISQTCQHHSFTHLKVSRQRPENSLTLIIYRAHISSPPSSSVTKGDHISLCPPIQAPRMFETLYTSQAQVCVCASTLRSVCSHSCDDIIIFTHHHSSRSSLTSSSQIPTSGINHTSGITRSRYLEITYRRPRCPISATRLPSHSACSPLPPRWSIELS